MHLLSLLLLAATPALADEDCAGGSCPFPHAPVAVNWDIPEDAVPPPIDQRPSAHLRTAVFALG